MFGWLVIFVFTFVSVYEYECKNSSDPHLSDFYRLLMSTLSDTNTYMIVNQSPDGW